LCDFIKYWISRVNIAEVKKTKQKQDDLIYLQNVVIKREIALIKKGNNS
jgi:hypothetical protein